MKKNVSFFIYSLGSGGAERIVSLLVNELYTRYNIKIVLMDDTIFYDIPKNVEVFYLDNSKKNESGLMKLLKVPYLGVKYYIFCRKHKIDVSLSFLNRPNYINIISKLIGSKSKTIISERAMPSFQHASGLKGAINRVLIKYLYKKADIITANSLGNSLDLKESFNCKSVKTIYNFFDLKKIEDLSKFKNDFRDEKFTFITIGRLDEGKNHKILIDAMKSIDAKLYIIGKGELKDNLQNQIVTNKLTEKVFLLGEKTNPYSYISKADCFVFSSLYEGFPNVLLEALACNLPIISSDCKSGPREILCSSLGENKQLNKSIKVAEYGILTPVNNLNSLKEAMQIMMNDSSLRVKLYEKSKTRTKEFSKEKIINEWIDLLEN